MANLFDSLQDNTFDVTTNTMGYPATWQPKAGGPLQSATVLYNDNTQKYKLSNMDFEPEGYRVEYRLSFFTGLKQSVDEGIDEKIIVVLPEGSLQFDVRKVDSKFDGKTFTAYLELI